MPAWYRCQNIWIYRILDFGLLNRNNLWKSRYTLCCRLWQTFASRKFWCSILLKNYFDLDIDIPGIYQSKTWGFRWMYQEFYSYCYFNWGFDLTNRRAFQTWIYKKICTNTIPNEMDFIQILHQGIAIF